MSKGVNLENTGKGPYHLDKSTQDMSLQHAKDSLEYNLKHAEEHLKQARENCEKLDKHGNKTPPPVSKELLDLFEYFEDAIGYEDSPQDKDAKLKDHIRRNY